MKATARRRYAGYAQIRFQICRMKRKVSLEGLMYDFDSSYTVLTGTSSIGHPSAPALKSISDSKSYLIVLSGIALSTDVGINLNPDWLSRTRLAENIEGRVGGAVVDDQEV